MPFPRSFLRHTMVWSLPGGETANCRVHWDNDGGGIVSLDDDVVDALAAKALTFWNALKNEYTAGVSYLGSKVSAVSVNDLVFETKERFITAVAGTSSGNPLPHEVAVVISLRTATASRSGRGRVYMPNPAAGTLVSTGRLNTLICDDYASMFATYLGAFTVDTSEFFSVIASGTQFQLRPITSAECGDVFDAQRRRRDNLVEARSTAPV